MMTNKTPRAIIKPCPNGRWEVRYVNSHKIHSKTFYTKNEALLFKTQFLNSRAMNLISKKSNTNWRRKEGA